MDGGAGVSQDPETNRRFRLRTVGGVLSELSRVYRAAWLGNLVWSDAGSAARILREIRQTIEGSELERRIEAVEARLNIVRQQPQPNGRDQEARL